MSKEIYRMHSYTYIMFRIRKVEIHYSDGEVGEIVSSYRDQNNILIELLPTGWVKISCDVEVILVPPSVKKIKYEYGA